LNLVLSNPGVDGFLIGKRPTAGQEERHQYWDADLWVHDVTSIPFGFNPCDARLFTNTILTWLRTHAFGWRFRMLAPISWDFIVKAS
jgi:hypothetical protein